MDPTRLYLNVNEANCQFISTQHNIGNDIELKSFHFVAAADDGDVYLRSSFTSGALTMFLKWALRVPVVWWYSITQLLLRISPLLSLREINNHGVSRNTAEGCDAFKCRPVGYIYIQIYIFIFICMFQSKLKPKDARWDWKNRVHLPSGHTS